MVSRKDDIIDILNKATTGWQPPPDQPIFVVETAEHTVYYYLASYKRAIIIKKDWEHRPYYLGTHYQNDSYIFNVVIVAQTETDLQDTYDQMVEVFNRYTASPWSTSALGTSTTYDAARVLKGKQDVRLAKFALDAQIILTEYHKDIVIA